MLYTSDRLFWFYGAYAILINCEAIEFGIKNVEKAHIGRHILHALGNISDVWRILIIAGQIVCKYQVQRSMLFRTVKSGSKISCSRRYIKMEKQRRNPCRCWVWSDIGFQARKWKRRRKPPQKAKNTRSEKAYFFGLGICILFVLQL